ncbi:MAG: hypothetical protein UR78_C0010G0024 [Candidatus Moranbacteria bacterium GW2011_GWF2_35_39]|nr:MAG: hypothetical protein UR78_C0010G0024 [Candidatus Moranbacteria bacterium GW2011_GWF2_35_39]OGI30902.1 MAG: hypothetical protein A2343_02155 [Candidatus Moranbacteria bacterium RIFOXYB12_FULL_35_8]
MPVKTKSISQYSLSPCPIILTQIINIGKNNYSSYNELMLTFQKIKDFCKKPQTILILILLVFFLKGLLLTIILPIFNGYDEARHYNTIQYLAEPREKNWPKNEKGESADGDLVQRFNYSEEIKKTAEKIRCVGGEDKCNLYANNLFISGFDGENEAEINNRGWKQYNDDYPVNIAGKADSLYHQIGEKIERMLGEKNILIRFYTLRIFSVFLGTIAIFIFYLILKNIGFSPKHSLLITAIISFQPKFSFYYSYVNYDPLLILLFAFFVFGAILSIKDGLNWKNLSLMISSIIFGIWVKGTALILLAVFIFLIFAVIYKKVSGKTKINDKYWFGLFFTISFSVIMITFQKHLPLIGNFNEISASFFRYFLKNIDPELISLSSKTYWGILSFDNWISLHLLEIVWFIQFFSILGLILFIFSKNKPEFLPEKKYIFFFILMIVALQAGIRLADWQYFTKYGKLGLQTPGRYFFPNIAIHITLVFVGLGMLLQYFKKEKYFDLVLALSLVSMLAFFMYHLLSTLLDFYL